MISTNLFYWNFFFSYCRQNSFINNKQKVNKCRDIKECSFRTRLLISCTFSFSNISERRKLWSLSVFFQTCERTKRITWAFLMMATVDKFSWVKFTTHMIGFCISLISNRVLYILCTLSQEVSQDVTYFYRQQGRESAVMVHWKRAIAFSNVHF